MYIYYTIHAIYRILESTILEVLMKEVARFDQLKQ